MPAIISWIKRQIQYIKDSLPDLIRGFIFFILAFSGLACALIMRYLGFNGAQIATASIAVEVVAMILCYIIFKSFTVPPEEGQPSGIKKAKR